MVKDKSSKCVRKTNISTVVPCHASHKTTLQNSGAQNFMSDETHSVVVEIQQSKDAVLAKALGESSGHFVVAQIQHEEAIKGGPVRDWTRQVVLVQREVAQVLATAKTKGDASAQVVLASVEVNQRRELSNLGGDGAGEAVRLEV